MNFAAATGNVRPRNWPRTSGPWVRSASATGMEISPGSSHETSDPISIWNVTTCPDRARLRSISKESDLNSIDSEKELVDRISSTMRREPKDRSAMAMG